MKPETLKQIKKQLRKLSDVYEILSTSWNGDLQNGRNATYPSVVITNVLLQNMAFDSTRCTGYNHMQAEIKLKKDLATLRTLNEYEDRGYMTQYAYQTAMFIIDGEEMSEIDHW